MRLIRTALRTVLTWTVGVLVTILGAISVIAIALFNDRSPAIQRVIEVWSHSWLWASGTSLDIRGGENVDPSRSYVVVANHLSTLDIMVCFLAVPVPIRYLAKKELFRIPLLAQAMRLIGIIEVDREARGRIHESVNKQAKKLIDSKRSLIIYAEGTRPRDGVMRRFKKGAFTMAIASGLPVLPLSIHGTFEAASPGRPWFRGGKVTAIVGEPIETSELEQADSNGLRDRTREIIAGNVSRLGGEVG